MSVSLLQLRALVTVVEADGFAAAATELGLTQSAVSHAIASLERELGGSVLTRRPKVLPTALGRQLLPQARSALAAVSAIESHATAHAQAGGTVRLGVVRTAVFGLIPELLPRWRAAYPEITVQVFEGDDDELPEWLEAGIIDAAVLVNPAQQHPQSVVVAEDEYAAVLPSDHPLAEQAVISPTDLLDDPMVVSDSGCGPYVRRIMRAADAGFRPVSVVRDDGALFGMVAGGVGVCLLPSLGKRMLPAGLVMVRLSPTEPRQLVFSGPLGRDWSPAVSSLAAECRDQSRVSLR